MMKKTLCFVGLVSMSSVSVAVDWMGVAGALVNDEAKTASSQASSTTAQTIDFAAGLVPALSESLGVSSRQASGGLGALFDLAKENVSAEEFATLSQSVPDMTGLLAAAPAVGGANDGLGGLLGSAGKYGKALSGAKEVYQQFAALGLDAAQVGQYINIAMSYLQSEGGQATVDIFSEGVASLIGN